jgi:hypothetical protein
MMAEAYLAEHTVNYNMHGRRPFKDFEELESVRGATRHIRYINFTVSTFRRNRDLERTAYQMFLQAAYMVTFLPQDKVSGKGA